MSALVKLRELCFPLHFFYFTECWPKHESFPFLMTGDRKDQYFQGSILILCCVRYIGGNSFDPPPGFTACSSTSDCSSKLETYWASLRIPCFCKPCIWLTCTSLNASLSSSLLLCSPVLCSALLCRCPALLCSAEGKGGGLTKMPQSYFAQVQ